MPASLSGVLARIGAIQSRFGISGDPSGDAGGGTSTFANVLNQVSEGASGTGSSAAAELSKLPQSERELIISQARREGVDPALALAVVLQESGGNPNAVSPSGALGLMQLMPGTVQELGVSKPLDPTQNLAGGLDYLRQKLTEFGSVPLGLAAYNAGSGAVSSWGGVPPYPETQSYVSNIMRARDDIARQLASNTAGGSTGTDPTHRGAAGGAASGSGAGASAGSRAGQGSAPVSTGGAKPPAPTSSSGANSAAPASDRVDVAQPRGMTPSRGGETDFAFLRGGQAVKPVTGQAAGANGVNADGTAAVVQARIDSAAGSAGSGRDGGRRGADATLSADLGGVSAGNGGQAQAGGGGYQGIGQGMSQSPQGGAASGPASSGNAAPTASAGAQGRVADGPAAGAPTGGSVSHVTIRSGGDQPVTVTLTDRADAVSARVVTQTPGMAQTLRDHAGALRSALAAHEVQLSDLAVRPASSDRSSNGHPQGGSHRPPRPAQSFHTTMPDSQEDTHEQSGG